MRDKYASIAFMVALPGFVLIVVGFVLSKHEKIFHLVGGALVKIAPLISASRTLGKCPLKPWNWLILPEIFGACMAFGSVFLACIKQVDVFNLVGTDFRSRGRSNSFVGECLDNITHFFDHDPSMECSSSMDIECSAETRQTASTDNALSRSLRIGAIMETLSSSL
ncbi:hypothetical protein BDV97DRAFT_197092 [Delphinella strobiligena]|nr:hypothetical protein BDV97DRAFT_197092 [Delphinella strobiligena]